MSACANAIKYALAYWDFKLDQDYTPKDDYALFILTQNYWNIKVQNYLEQDKKRNRDTSNNIKESDCAFYRKLFLSTGCHICKARFTSKNPPTLDRINNNMGHSADNVKPCCLFCNKFKSNKDENLTRLVIQLKNFCLMKSLPMTITDEEIYQILRSGITGGLSQVMHRYNVAGETKINQLKYINGKVISQDTDYTMTHLLTLDFNCQYPSVMSSEPHKFIKYMGNKLFMAGQILDKITDKQTARNLIYNQNRFNDVEGMPLFIAVVKGHIDEQHINDFINFLPILRNNDIMTDENIRAIHVQLITEKQYVARQN
ncbi:MAG: hypothetical protein EZS28_039947 [Streblomastix strix]|uniref:DNA-directed DNA polymerase n=1 Tax=Streblomastix strix TaxID=222440 RepID=A0A5J4U1D2_9EUKA|nr:MAG: hypothetical protein EZS28_039947 [Streblomastix strix]